MGYEFCIGNCVACGRVFGFNPRRVPSVVVKGSREPVCAGCMTVANETRKKNGLPELRVLPGAYEPEEV
jgi:hypothetical protein